MFRIYSLVVQSQFNNPTPAHMDYTDQTGNRQKGGGAESVTDRQEREGQVADVRKVGNRRKMRPGERKQKQNPDENN